MSWTVEAWRSLLEGGVISRCFIAYRHLRSSSESSLEIQILSPPCMTTSRHHEEFDGFKLLDPRDLHSSLTRVGGSHEGGIATVSSTGQLHLVTCVTEGRAFRKFHRVW